MDRERRKIYRVVPDDAHRLEVTVRTEDGKAFRGEVLDVTIDGAGTRFERETGPVFGLGHSVTLIFSAPWLDEPVEVSAKVRSRVERGKSRHYRYGFVLDQSVELEKRLPGGVFRLSNRRVAYRVSPDPTKPVAVAIKVPGARTPKVTARLKDISVSGLALLVDPEAESTLGELDVIEMSFRLPTSDKDFQLVGWIRSRELVNEHARYGVEFDDKRSKHFARRRDEIFAYVADRQRQELQKPVH